MKETIKVVVEYEMSQEEFKEKLGLPPNATVQWVDTLREDNNLVVECVLVDDGDLEFDSVEDLELM